MAVKELIVHIGAGKTGTTALQNSLWASREELRKQGFEYIGLPGIWAGRKHFDWQDENAVHTVWEQDAAQCNSQIHHVLSSEIAALDQSGIHTVVLSNEQFFARNDRYLDALGRLSKGGLSVRVVCYLRNHAAWLQSAYVEWCVKSQFFEGPFLTFVGWEKKRNFEFYPSLMPVVEAFRGNITLRNFDYVNDIVGDFSQLIGARVSSRFRSNETPSTEVLAAVVVDAVRRGGVRNYNDFLARMGGAENISKQATGLPDLNIILPNPETMAQALKEYAQDAEDMNRLFAEFGEKPFKDGSDALRNHQVDHWKMFQLLLRVLSAGIDRQERLETRLGTLAAELEDLKSLVGKG